MNRRTAEHIAQTIHHRLTATLRARVLITLVNALNASAPSSFFEQCDTLRAITAPRSARSARLLVGSIPTPSGKHSRLPRSSCQPSSF